jgi:glucan endo-1,3-alpha-glucosidase
MTWTRALRIVSSMCWLANMLGNVFAPASAAELNAVAPPTQEKKVFAHYMVCCPTAGQAAGVPEFKQEIREAQSRGLDGFALNVGGWQESEPVYKKRVLEIYEAASELNSGFELFVSVDGAARAEIEGILDTVGRLPNQFRLRGKPVISTFSGEGKDYSDGHRMERMVASRGFVFLPFFYSHPVSSPEGKIDEISAKSLANEYSTLDGFFFFGAAASGGDLAESIRTLGAIWKGRHRIFMAGISPYYRGSGKNFRVFEDNGFEGMQAQWIAAIKSNADFVELVTWNDWAESTYVAPFGPPTSTDLWRGYYAKEMLSHVAYLDASQYYIDWFKTGVQPHITKDEVFYFYRLNYSSRDAFSEKNGRRENVGRPRGANELVDKIFITTYLKAPAVLVVETGGGSQSFSLPAGVSDVRVPMQLGSPKFALWRDGEKIAEKEGEQEITNNDTSSVFNYFGGHFKSEKIRE